MAYQFGPSEQPIFDGGPYSPAHHPLRRAAYMLVALIVGICAQLGHALVMVNLPSIAGTIGVTQSDASWLLAVYVATNASGNLLLVRARIRFGVPKVTIGLLSAYVIATLVQLAHPDFTTALVVRMVSGAVATSLTTITIYNMLQVVAPRHRPLALVIGVTIPQLAVPIARLVPLSLLTVGQGLPLIELSIAMTAILLLVAVPLPPSIRARGFKPLDFLTFALAFPGMILLCGAISAGRSLWWMDTPWIGVALAGAIALLTMAFLIEHHRSNPLLLTDWIGSKDILRFIAIALLVRFALAEQTYGAIGILTVAGLTNDQLHILFLIVLGAMVLGLVTAVMTWAPPRTFTQIMVAALIIALGAWLDGDATNLTRPEQLYLSQALLGFGACLFIGPALVYGFGQVLQLGRNYLISMLVMFGISQNIGGLLGASLLGTYQISRAKAQAAALSEHLVAADPLVADRLAGQGAAGLYRSLQREASILAFNDVFQLVTLIALLTALVIAWPKLVAQWRAHFSSAESPRP